jgi:hypothetical protein
MMMEFNNPIPVVLEDGQEAMAIYVRDGGTWDNDVWCCVLCKGGYIRHYASSQLRMAKNATFGIEKINQQNG